MIELKLRPVIPGILPTSNVGHEQLDWIVQVKYPGVKNSPERPVFVSEPKRIVTTQIMVTMVNGACIDSMHAV